MSSKELVARCRQTVKAELSESRDLRDGGIMLSRKISVMLTILYMPQLFLA